MKKKTTTTIEYHEHKEGYVSIEDSTPLGKFYRSMAKTPEELLRALRSSFPNQEFELRLAG